MDEKKKMLLIINPCSGKGLVKNHLLEIVDIFVKADYDVQIYTTQCAQDATSAVLRYGAGKDLIVCSGGDGTLNETVSGVLQLPETLPLGYIPAGSTNDFASSLEIPKKMRAAAQAVVDGEDYRIDVGMFCEEQYFLYVAGFGAFTEVSYLTPQDKKNVLGHQAYMLEGVKSLTSIKPYHMRLELDEETVEGDFIFGMVTNTVSVGGFKGLVSQEVALNDGLFEVLLIRMPKTPLELSEVVTGLFLKEENQELVYKVKTSRLRASSPEPVDWVLDGEFGGSRTDVVLQNLPRRVNIRRNLAQIPQKTKKYRKQSKKNVEI